MIQRNRSTIFPPASLGSPGGLASREIAAVHKHFANRRNKLPEFAAYKSADVVHSLSRLFERKCAYCESLFAHTQPMDVEHWRPKKKVTSRPQSKGYPWLAADWTNLLPSCIDCNRERRQHVYDARRGVPVLITAGKQSQFPISGTRARRPSDPLFAEHPILIDPCVDDPRKFLSFRADGVVAVRPGLSRDDAKRAAESINVYAMNRSGLVEARRRAITVAQWHLDGIQRVGQLIKALDQESLPARVRRIYVAFAQETVKAEMMQLNMLRGSDSAFSAAVREHTDQAIQQMRQSSRRPSSTGRSTI